jgi:hypothetical protein
MHLKDAREFSDAFTNPTKAFEQGRYGPSRLGALKACPWKLMDGVNESLRALDEPPFSELMPQHPDPCPLCEAMQQSSVFVVRTML